MIFSKVILALSIAVLMYSCNNIRPSDKELEEQAKLMVQRLDTSTLNFLNNWDYSQRGDFWTKSSRDSLIFNCSFYPSIDTPKISAHQVDKFLSYFQSSLKLDTAFNKIQFTRIADTTLMLIGTDNYGQDTLLFRSLSLGKTFPEQNPFDILTRLTKLKDTLNVMGIAHYPAFGFIQFYLPDARHVLTYLPDTLLNSSHLNKFWKADFLKGKQIKPNWNFRKLENPIDGG